MSYHLKITSISPECYKVSVKVENHIFQATFLKSKNGPFLVTFGMYSDSTLKYSDCRDFENFLEEPRAFEIISCLALHNNF